MKKIALLSTALLTVATLYAEPQEVQSVINITPDNPAELGQSKPRSLPTPPAEIKGADINAEDLKITTTPKQEMTKKSKKSITEMSSEEQITYLNHKVDKLRQKNHKIRAKIHGLENEIARLKQELKDLKENKDTHKKGE